MDQQKGLQYDPEIMELYKKYVPMPDDGNIYILMGIDWLFKWVIYKYKCVCGKCNVIFFDEVNRDVCRTCKQHVCQYTEYRKYDALCDKVVSVIGCVCGLYHEINK